jgi:hypothetical protein
MRGMRESVVARFVSHPVIEFGAGRRLARSRPRLGLPRSGTVFHARRRSGSTVGMLRCSTSRFRFPTVGRLGLRGRRTELSRARRA